jgi:hypothetical protein
VADPKSTVASSPISFSDFGGPLADEYDRRLWQPCLQHAFDGSYVVVTCTKSSTNYVGYGTSQEIAECLRTLLPATVCVNTLMVQGPLTDVGWADTIGPEHRCGPYALGSGSTSLPLRAR